MQPPEKRDPLWLERVPTWLACLAGYLVKEFFAGPIGSLGVSAFAGAAAWLAISWRAAVMTAIIVMCALTLDKVRRGGRDAALHYHNALQFNKMREAWPPSKSLVFYVDADLSVSGNLTIRVRVTNVGAAAWIIRGCAIKRKGLNISYGIAVSSDLTTDCEYNIDTGQSATVELSTEVKLPAGVAIAADQFRWGVIGVFDDALSLKVEAPESPAAPETVPLIAQTRLESGALWKKQTYFHVRVID